MFAQQFCSSGGAASGLVGGTLTPRRDRKGKNRNGTKMRTPREEAWKEKKLVTE